MNRKVRKLPIVVAAISLLALFSAASANIETDGFGFVHTSPTAIAFYSTANPVAFTDSTTWTARRVATLKDPESITVTSHNGDESGDVNSHSKAHTWTGTNIDNWNGDDSLNGSKSEAAGSHGYFAQLTRSIDGGTDASWVDALPPYGTALITGGFTVH